MNQGEHLWSLALGQISKALYPLHCGWQVQSSSLAGHCWCQSWCIEPHQYLTKRMDLHVYTELHRIAKKPGVKQMEGVRSLLGR